jgi:predicted O-methyltransferase YrrM
MITTTELEKREIERFVRDMGARRVLEIGAFRGETTRVLLDATETAGGRVVVIDPMRWSSEILRNGIGRHLARIPRVLAPLERWLDQASYEPAFWRNVGEAARERVRLLRALSTDPALLASHDADLRTFDVVFVDGDHSHEGALHDLQHWGGRVRAGGLVLVHDATPRFPGVVRAIEAWAHPAGFEVTWPARDSLCVIRVLAAHVQPHAASRAA